MRVLTKSLGVVALAAAFANPSWSYDTASRYKLLYSFGYYVTGALPGDLVLDKAGNILGDVYTGGPTQRGGIFRFSPDGTYTMLYSFSGADGSSPNGFIYDRHSGRIIGSTGYGGRVEHCRKMGCGVVYSLDADGTERLLHKFLKKKDGFGPSAPVRDGNVFFGVAYANGPNGNGSI